MNQQQQIDIIQAHMDGKRVMCRRIASDNQDDIPEYTGWLEVAKGEFRFDFRHWEFKTEPRRIEAFMAIPSGVLQSLGRESYCVTTADVGNQPPTKIPQGHVLVKINYLEP